MLLFIYRLNSDPQAPIMSDEQFPSEPIKDKQLNIVSAISYDLQDSVVSLFKFMYMFYTSNTFYFDAQNDARHCHL